MGINRNKEARVVISRFIQDKYNIPDSEILGEAWYFELKEDIENQICENNEIDKNKLSLVMDKIEEELSGDTGDYISSIVGDLMSATIKYSD